MRSLIAMLAVLSLGLSSAVAAGVARVAYSDEPGTLDPAIGYTAYEWPIEHALFLTLLDYDDGASLMPWAALTPPEVSSDLRSYTFHIRSGITFSDGEPVDAAAFRYGIERVLDPATGSPQGGVEGWFGNLVGAQAFVDGEAEHVAGIDIPDALTITFTLARPDRTFLNVLATPFAAALPTRAVELWGEDFAHHVVSSAQFVLESWVPGERLVLAKNPGYFDPGSAASLERIEFVFGLDAPSMLEQAKAGDIDVIGEHLPSTEYASLSKDPEYAPYLHRTAASEVDFVFMNTQVSPFDDPRVREAVATAIDKASLVEALANRAIVADQILPPPVPGYDPTLPASSSDPERARTLLAQAGYPDGLELAFLTSDNAPGVQVGAALEQQLALAGIRLDVTALPMSDYFDALMTPGKAAFGYTGWLQDYPDPSDFLTVMFHATAGAFNVSAYSNPDVDALLDEAQGLPLEQAVPLYRQAQRLILDDRPVVPLLYPTDEVWANPRLSTFAVHPMWQFVYAAWRAD